MTVQIWSALKECITTYVGVVMDLLESSEMFYNEQC